MACITIRDLPREAVRNLRSLAKRQGISLEAHIRELLVREARLGGGPRENVAELALKLFGPRHGADLQFQPREMLRPE